ncbi:general vesicular transport factor p115 [Anopheles cruzii]|uniref:general vesicular transport factor p115 n=1 Tax=Anopheles cruzii TaxID=68878 RepID=UPI0022EC3000|nr:general vesicular transport factor p115 [Anopheles cruzii]
MNFLKSGLQSVLGSQQTSQAPTGAETVELLVERVTSSTLLDDRRDACRALKALSKKYRIEVGIGMTALMQVLETDRSDCEIIGYCLDTLCHVTSPEQFEEEEDNPNVTANIGEQFTEIFIKTPDNVCLVLGCLEEYDFRVRWAAIKLLTNLLANRPKEIQEIVLVSPMGVSKMMDLLIDSREVIRNDALLLMIQLTKGNGNIQKIVAFENAFDRLLDVIKEEGCSDGGIVVEDCLILMLNLLKNNPSNQQFFKEGSYIQRLAPMLELPPEQDQTGMSPQKVSNLHCMLQVVRALVSPSNPQQVIGSCQKAIRSSGLLAAICNIIMASGVPPDLLIETINTIAEVIRGDGQNQDYFNSVVAPCDPPLSAIVLLLMSMVNDKQPLPLRCAVLYCFQSYLYRNDGGQSSLVKTLLQSSEQAATITSGQLLCRSLFSTDPLSNWFAAVSLSHALLDNPAQKEQLLRVVLATSHVSKPVSLLEQCNQLLQQATCKFQAKVGLLMLLSVWLADCQLAVRTFLSTPGTVAYLTGQISANEHGDNEYLVQGLCAFLMGICIQFNDNSVQEHQREFLCQLLIKRIGLDTYNKKLGEVSKHENYSKSAKQPQIRIAATTDLLLDYEFCRLFKALEATVTKTVNGFSTGGQTIAELTLSQEASGLVAQYKDIIREQDGRLQALHQQLAQTEGRVTELTQSLEQTRAGNAQLQDQNILLKAQLQAASNSVRVQGGAATASSTASSPLHVLTTQEGDRQEALESRLSMLTLAQQTDRAKLAFYETENSRLLGELDQLRARLAVAEARANESGGELEKVRHDQEDLLELLTDQENKLQRYRMELKRVTGQPFEDDDDEDGEEVEHNAPTKEGQRNGTESNGNGPEVSRTGHTPSHTATDAANPIGGFLC